jgi:hypothetical protein
MGARERLQTALSVWVAPLSRAFCPRGRVQTRGGRLRRPAGDAVKEWRHGIHMRLSQATAWAGGGRSLPPATLTTCGPF